MGAFRAEIVRLEEQAERMGGIEFAMGGGGGGEKAVERAGNGDYARAEEEIVVPKVMVRGKRNLGLIR